MADLDPIRDRLVDWDACHVVEQMRDGDGYADQFAEDVGALLAEVERLRDGIRANREGVMDAEEPADAYVACEALWALLDDQETHGE